MSPFLSISFVLACVLVNGAAWWLWGRITAYSLQVAEEQWEYWCAVAKQEEARADDLQLANESLSERNEMLVDLLVARGYDRSTLQVSADAQLTEPIALERRPS